MENPFSPKPSAPPLCSFSSLHVRRIRITIDHGPFEYSILIGCRVSINSWSRSSSDTILNTTPHALCSYPFVILRYLERLWNWNHVGTSWSDGSRFSPPEPRGRRHAARAGRASASCEPPEPKRHPEERKKAIRHRGELQWEEGTIAGKLPWTRSCPSRGNVHQKDRQGCQSPAGLSALSAAADIWWRRMSHKLPEAPGRQTETPKKPVWVKQENMWTHTHTHTQKVLVHLRAAVRPILGGLRHFVHLRSIKEMSKIASEVFC